MAAQTFDDYFKGLQSGDGPVTTIEWYLAKIREVAAQHGNTTKGQPSGTEQQTSAQTIQQAQDEARKQTAATADDLRKQVESMAIYTEGGFNQQQVGRLLLFRYDPKGRATMPYYDMFPLVFPFRVKGNSMWGLNMHYLHPLYRARLLYSLMSRVNTTDLAPSAKLLLTWKIMKNMAYAPYMRPAVKRYNMSQLRTRISVIDPKQWRKVVFMPIARFMKANEYKVWQDSTKKANEAALKVETK